MKLFTAGLGLMVLVVGGVGGQAGGRLQFLTVNDPVYGVEMGKMAFFAGWTGTVGVTRNDAWCAECNGISMTMTSPMGVRPLRRMGGAAYGGV